MVEKYCIIFFCLIFAFEVKASGKQSLEVREGLNNITALHDTIDNRQKLTTIEDVKKLNANLSIDCVEAYENLRYYYEVDSIKIEIISHKIKGSYRFNDELIVNNNRIGSFKGGVEKTMINNHNIYFCSATKDSTYFYHLDNGVLKILNSFNEQISPYNTLAINNQFILYLDEQKGGFILYSLEKPNESMLFDFSNLVNSNEEFIREIQINSHKWILEFGEWAGGYDNLSYYIYDRRENSFLDVTSKFNFNDHSHEVFYANKCQEGNKLLINAPIFSKDNKLIRQDSFILDSVWNIKGRALALVSSNIYSPIGHKVSNNEIVKYFYKLKEDKKYFKMAYEFNYELETLYFEIYKNRLISNQSLERLTANQLTGLANIILANYGYNFTNPLLHKYYGVYDFYYKQELKTKDVWNKISKNNFNNLIRIITKIEDLKSAPPRCRTNNVIKLRE